MAIKYELIANAGTYTDSTGAEKKRWHKCGVVMTTKNGGLAAKLESLPIGFDGWMTLAEPREKEAAPAKSTRRADDPPTEDIPF